MLTLRLSGSRVYRRSAGADGYVIFFFLSFLPHLRRKICLTNFHTNQMGYILVSCIASPGC